MNAALTVTILSNTCAIWHGVLVHEALECLNVTISFLKPIYQPLPQAGVASGFPANCRSLNICAGAVFVQLFDNVMMFAHKPHCANWHIKGQGPNDTLNDVHFDALCATMANDFKNALIWHMAEHDTKIAELVRQTGVSRDVINKLISRDNASTTVENGMLIAAYYGKTVNQFIALDNVDADGSSRNLFEMLLPAERRLVEAQMLGIVSQRGR